MAESNAEMKSLIEILRARKVQGRPVELDVATHAALLVSNGWKAAEALEESARTLDDAEREGAC